jgi:hypothetical protein
LLDADAGVLDAGNKLDELVVVVADVAARVGGNAHTMIDGNLNTFVKEGDGAAD